MCCLHASVPWRSQKPSITWGESWGRTSFFLAFLFGAFWTAALASLPESACRLFFAVLWSAVAENSTDPRSKPVSAEVRFGVRGLEGKSFAGLTTHDPGSSSDASSIIRTNSSWTEEDRRKSPSLCNDLDLGTLEVIPAEPRPTAVLLLGLPAFTGSGMPFFLWEKKSVTLAWDMLLLLGADTGTAEWWRCRSLQ